MGKKKKLDRFEFFINAEGKPTSRFKIGVSFILEARDMNKKPLKYCFVPPTNYISVLSDDEEIYVHYK